MHELCLIYTLNKNRKSQLNFKHCPTFNKTRNYNIYRIFPAKMSNALHMEY